MSIQMIGVDHTKASIDIRTLFSFTKKEIAETLELWKNNPQILGCVIISTCNRMEIWASTAEQTDLFAMLCEVKKTDRELYRKFVIQRSGQEAVWHLMELSCGLQSKILGEDQIITQVKTALNLSREVFATDNVLEVLFRMAVTAAKKVKTSVVLSSGNQSAIHRAVEVMKQQGFEFEGKKCMVIGNGEMGKLSANVFREAGASVTVTVRQYRSGVVEIPHGCERIDYGRRMELFPECDYVVSATSSPNYTLTKELVEGCDLQHPVTLIDLAVPRDIEPGIGELDRVELFDIDYFEADRTSEQTKANIIIAEKILSEQLEEFFDWYEGRDVIDQVSKIRRYTESDFHLRTSKQFRHLLEADGDEKQKEQLEKLQDYADQAAGKVVNKLLFGLKGKVSDEVFRECILAMGELIQHE